MPHSTTTMSSFSFYILRPCYCAGWKFHHQPLLPTPTSHNLILFQCRVARSVLLRTVMFEIGCPINSKEKRTGWIRPFLSSFSVSFYIRVPFSLNACNNSRHVFFSERGRERERERESRIRLITLRLRPWLKQVSFTLKSLAMFVCC